MKSFVEMSSPDELSFLCGHTVRNGEGSWFGRNANWNLLLSVEGRGRVAERGGELRMPPRSLSVLAPGAPRKFFIDDSWEVYWAHFQLEDRIDAIAEWPESGEGMRQVLLEKEPFEAALASFKELHRISMTRAKGWRALAFCLLESVILRGNMASARGPSDKRLELARELLGREERRPDMEEIARSCALSRSSLFAKFKEAYGISPRVYRENRMLRRSLELLENRELSLAEIAGRVGMRNVFYFSARFKKAYGMPPSEYRRKSLTPL
jgi:AraC-like DNA-binding protein